MEKMIFTKQINAPKEKVWNILWEDASYRKWTAPFCEGGYAVTDWKENSKALFLTPNGEGMVSRIKANRPNELMEIEHLGLVKNGVETTEGDAVKEWAGAIESYMLKENESGTLITVQMDTNAEMKKYFEDTWPKALEQLKQLSEQSI